MNTPLFERVPPGPILVVADNEAIARSGPRWARLFQAVRRLYRVRLSGPSTVEAIVAEAKSLEAVAVIWVGDAVTQSLAESAANHLGLPAFHEEIVPHAPEP